MDELLYETAAAQGRTATAKGSMAGGLVANDFSVTISNADAVGKKAIAIGVLPAYHKVVAVARDTEGFGDASLMTIAVSKGQEVAAQASLVDGGLLDGMAILTDGLNSAELTAIPKGGVGDVVTDYDRSVVMIASSAFTAGGSILCAFLTTPAEVARVAMPAVAT